MAQRARVSFPDCDQGVHARQCAGRIEAFANRGVVDRFRVLCEFIDDFGGR